ncbi:AlpA family phage regulatory protein [Shewanella sp. FJAT-51649]|uniref:helix-turn-helix transcriptional regulator n=1 Tax=Shewanella sp. FJAT-51649 TaxID=2864210 RepID=UPI001C65E078|nr:AlpA family phage regulatory protein [Shewanella sp. FJAT-51649]QYJ70305.1 AlpA family phage regulatory protein [Shewanella sp. FJAT-51649]
MNIEIKIERKKQVLSRVKFSKATLHRYINLGKFPPAINLGGRAVGFLKHEVDAYLIAAASGENLNDAVDKILSNRKELLCKH